MPNAPGTPTAVGTFSLTDHHRGDPGLPPTAGVTYPARHGGGATGCTDHPLTPLEEQR